LDIESYVGVKEQDTIIPPEYIPKNIEAVFKKGITCLAGGCYIAADKMFRLCIELALCSMLPKHDSEDLDRKARREVGLRLPLIIATGLLPTALTALKKLSSCIKENGNNGAHAGPPLKIIEGENLLDITIALLEHMYTEPERLRLEQKAEITHPVSLL
jgi:hypothetical protein